MCIVVCVNVNACDFTSINQTSVYGSFTFNMNTCDFTSINQTSVYGSFSLIIRLQYQQLSNRKYYQRNINMPVMGWYLHSILNHSIFKLHAHFIVYTFERKTNIRLQKTLEVLYLTNGLRFPVKRKSIVSFTQ